MLDFGSSNRLIAVSAMLDLLCSAPLIINVLMTNSQHEHEADAFITILQFEHSDRSQFRFS